MKKKEKLKFHVENNNNRVRYKQHNIYDYFDYFSIHRVINITFYFDEQ